MMLQNDYEEFTEEQIKTLENYVTNTSSNIFALRNLPEVIKGALFSRYSRSSLGLRSLLLKEFISNEDESSFSGISSSPQKNQMTSIKKAQNFYDRILDGYGDDSIGELGGAHLAIENVSMIAAKIIEDARIGGSPLEKSTRYIYFDQQVNGEYLFFREPILMTSAYRDKYVNTCNMLFETYSKLIPPLTEKFEKENPKDPAASKAAYTASIRAKVLDCLRGILPAGTLTNMGIYGNGRFYQNLIQKLNCHPLAELQDIGKRSFDELSHIIPSFIRRSSLDHYSQKSFLEFYDEMSYEIALVTAQHTAFENRSSNEGVTLLSYDSDAVIKVAASILFANSNKSLKDLLDYCRDLPDEEIERILDTASNSRKNRREKSPRALEHANFTFEILTDFGIYRDLHRHRMLTQERQLLTCDYGYYLPPEVAGSELENDYVRAMHLAKETYDSIAEELPEEAQYVIPMAYNVRWYFHVNLRALQWICELRSAPAGHPNYRRIAQDLAKAVIAVFPAFERFFKYVDFEGYELGRLGQEIKKAEREKIQANS